MTVHKPLEVVACLADAGLPPIDVLRRAVVAGEQQRVSCTPLDAPTYPGVSAWGEAVRHLRYLLVPHGWLAQNTNNLPLVVDPVRKIGIAITAGKDGVGKADRCPTTKQPKGAVTRGLVMTNKGQMNIFGNDRRFVPMPDPSDITTWLLLVFTEYKPRNEDVGDHVAFCELSLPAEIDEEGYITEWTERLILEPVRIDELPALPQEDDDEEDLDVPVTRL